MIYKLVIKRLFDIVISFLGLICISPLLLVVSLFIKFESRGSVLFYQTRLGKNGKEFRIIKFRTMCMNAEYIGDGLKIKSDSDSRITKVGNFLRKTSLDELPQLFNILKGDMSLVGPRPPVHYFPYEGYGSYPEWAKKRFIIRPGITGLAQCTVRNSVTWDERIVLDIQYIDNLSFIMDLKIIYWTILRVLKSENIYLEKEKKDE
ncbi:sugar transferase [Candidatus Enterococcus clewellii]|uniref:Bacterial sugar transferase domain-containing protein n=1 Tax=Candidatus Enterococcus clewellii TaxID=1834193 RepID=A0AAQ3Y135_9ENTE